MNTVAAIKRGGEIVEASDLTGLLRVFAAGVGLCRLPQPRRHDFPGIP